jgi:TRAP-type uncharacterized transport system fused permease subunit
MFGIIAWATFLEGFTFRKTNTMERLILCVSASCLLLPVDHLITYLFGIDGEFRYQLNIVGIILIASTLLMQKSRQRLEASPGKV